MTIELNIMQTTALAMMLYVLGRYTVNHIAFLKRCCIPAPVVGGMIFALLHLLTHQMGILTFTFDTTIKDVFMIWFFTSVGYGASFKVLKKGASCIIRFVLLCAILITVQDLIGSVGAGIFGLDGRLGLCMSSIPLLGGHGTSASFGHQFEAMGIAGAEVVALACATYGLVAGSLMGGPIARTKIAKYGLHSEVPTDTKLETVETAQQPDEVRNQNSTDILNGFILLIVAAGIGSYINIALADVITLPTYMGAVVVGLIIRNVCDSFKIELDMHSVDTAGNVCLNVFLAIALMSLKLWELAALALPMVVILLVQTLFMFLFASFVVFRAMGRDYEAACLTTAFCGFGMGATPNAMANMQSVTDQYGPAPTAFFVVPVVGGMFSDFLNTGIITVFLNFLPK